MASVNIDSSLATINTNKNNTRNKRFKKSRTKSSAISVVEIVNDRGSDFTQKYYDQQNLEKVSGVNPQSEVKPGTPSNHYIETQSETKPETSSKHDIETLSETKPEAETKSSSSILPDVMAKSPEIRATKESRPSTKISRIPLPIIEKNLTTQTRKSTGKFINFLVLFIHRLMTPLFIYLL